MYERQANGWTKRIVFKALDILSPTKSEIPYVALPRIVPHRFVPAVARSSTSEERSRVVPLPSFRPRRPRARCLTPPVIEDTEQEFPAACEQIQSKFLQLPPEIRLLIYEEVMGGADAVVHMVRRHKRLGHTLCHSIEGEDACQQLRCRGYKLPSGNFVQEKPGVGHGCGNIIALLQSCREIYAEAMPVLYDYSTFDFDSMETLIDFSCAALPRRLDSIQSVQLYLRFDHSMIFQESVAQHDWPMWERMWRILGSMVALRTLRARIVWGEKPVTNIQEKRLLQPALVVRDLDIFEISLKPLKGGGEVKIKDCPFQIVRRN